MVSSRHGFLLDSPTTGSLDPLPHHSMCVGCSLPYWNTLLRLYIPCDIPVTAETGWIMCFNMATHCNWESNPDLILVVPTQASNLSWGTIPCTFSMLPLHHCGSSESWLPITVRVNYSLTILKHTKCPESTPAYATAIPSPKSFIEFWVWSRTRIMCFNMVTS